MNFENEFEEWLLTRYKNDNGKTVSSIKSRCVRIERYEGNLDKHYKNDGCRSLIDKLLYSADDERYNRPPRHNIPIDGNKITGTASLKSAVKLYVEFIKGEREE